MKGWSRRSLDRPRVVSHGRQEEERPTLDPQRPSLEALRLLQRTAGNSAVAEMLTPQVQRDAATGAVADTSKADAGSGDVSDPAVDALDLAGKAKKVANAVKKKHPSISFTSGRRSETADQARAMAGNVVANRQYIINTYGDKTLAKELQDWVDKNPDAKTKEDIAKGLQDIMDGWDAAKKGRLSAHFSGEAFDIQPQTEDADAIKKDAKDLAEKEGGQFLEKESGLIRWHVQVRGD